MKKNFKAELFSDTITNYFDALRLVDKEDYSMAHFAKKIGISKATLSRLVNKKFVPDLETFFKVCKYIGYNMQDFFKNK